MKFQILIGLPESDMHKQIKDRTPSMQMGRMNQLDRISQFGMVIGKDILGEFLQHVLRIRRHDGGLFALEQLPEPYSLFMPTVRPTLGPAALILCSAQGLRGTRDPSISHPAEILPSIQGSQHGNPLYRRRPVGGVVDLAQFLYAPGCRWVACLVGQLTKGYQINAVGNDGPLPVDEAQLLESSRLWCHGDMLRSEMDDFVHTQTTLLPVLID
jgi:hypothetical protein